MEGGGADRDRTGDLSSAIAALSQLSYGPRPEAFRDRPSALSSRGAAPAPLALLLASPLHGPRLAEEHPMVPLISFIVLVIDLYIWVVIASAILSWLIAFNVVNTQNRFVYTVADMLYRVTEPALRPIRNIIPNLGGIDISPVILILFLLFIRDVVLLGWILPAVAPSPGY